MSSTNILRATKLDLDTPGGRPLVRDLALAIGREQVALVGRNGAGKSSLLEVLSGAEAPARGRIVRSGTTLLVRQDLRDAFGALSPGERRLRALEDAWQRRPDLLLLDEPTRDLDALGVAWLLEQLEGWDRALIVASHDRRVLRPFRQFFVLAESGCRAFAGGFDDLLRDLELHDRDAARRYARNLGRLLDKERHTETVRRRRARKKNVGRVRELGRCPARIRLNAKRGYKQVSQATRALLQTERISTMREWVRSTRRALSVDLPLEVATPALLEPTDEPIVMLKGVSARAGERELFGGIDLTLGRERVAVVGPNGSGKTTLLNIVVRAAMPERIGFIAQNANNWRGEESLLDRLGVGSQAAALELLVRHRFPLALAERPLGSLCPGERVRAALICLFRRRPAVELLVLDEPTEDLDLQATVALEAVLRAWPGGLLVASHDDEFLQAIGVGRWIELGGTRA